MARNMGRSAYAPANGNGTHGPSTNGNGTHGPSTNGNGVHEPSTNGSGVQGASPNGNGVREADRPDEVEVGMDAANAPDAGEPKTLRDKLGRYCVNTVGGPGNPFGRHVARNRRIILAAISDAEVEALVRKVYEQAMSGCAWATKLMLQYLVGKPVAAPNPDRVNHEEWEMRLEQPRSEEWELQRQQIPHVGALLVHRQVDVARTQEMANEFRANAARDMAREQKRRERAERRARHKEERRRRGK